MPHDALLRYLEEVETAIGTLRDSYVEFYEEEILTPHRANLRIRVRFYNGCLLELNESIVHQDGLEHLGYRYHFQGKDNELIFRYDNAPHFSDLQTFPDHKHHQTGIDCSGPPSILKAIEEASEISSRYARS
jgi:hypothetical protein